MIAINMKMPDNCIECRFGQSECGFCHAMTANFVGYVYQGEDEGRPDWCPLVELDYPDFSNSYVDPDSYVRVGDIMDCLLEVLRPESDLMHIEGLFEWAMGKRALSKDELFEYLYRDFEEREVLDE